MIIANIWSVFTRRKKYAAAANESTQLRRVLSTLDLTALGVGSTLGVGVYVIAGQVARDIAGPAVVVSFFIAAVASILSGLCYAEFGSRIPKAGSAYVYSYVTVGELVAFIIGWNLILEYVIGAASVAKGISLYVDMLAEDVIKNTFKDIAPIDFSIMAEYFDFFAFGLALLFSVALAFGLRESSKLNNVITGLNLLVVLFIIIGGAIKSDVENWNIPANELKPNIGDGGFLPFGIKGMLKGAATCFYAFVGFDCIATAGEEVKNPKRAIPFAIIGSQMIIFIAYFATSTVLTMMVPFYEQNVNAPFPYAFLSVGWDEAKWVVAIGGICGLFTSLFGSMLPLPRILYALASDGLIFKFLGKVNKTFSTPLIGTLIAGIITGLMAALFDLTQLVNMMSIGTLLAYTLVSTCVLILRYRDAYAYDEKTKSLQTKKSFLKNIFNIGKNREPTHQSQKISLTYILIYTLLAFIMALLMFLLYNHLIEGQLYMIILVSVIGGLMIIILFLLCFQPTTKEKLTFKVPFVPIIPAFSILINIYLMLMLDAQTWIRFGIWMLIGIPIYLLCIRKSCTSPTKTSTHLNGHTNSAFVKFEENSLCPSEEKSSSDSGIERSMENIRDEYNESPKMVRKEEEILVQSRKSITSIENALAILDEAIPKEYNDLNKEEDFDKLRRKSYGNISVASSGGLVKEDVVAIVHREDVKSGPTTPIVEIPSAPFLSDEDEEQEKEEKDGKEGNQNLDEEKNKNVYKELNQNFEKDINKEFKDENQNFEGNENQKFEENENQNKEKEENKNNNELELKPIQSPRPSIIFSDFDDEETDTDSLEYLNIPYSPSQDDLQKYNISHIPRISLMDNSNTSDVLSNASESFIPPPPPIDAFENFKPYVIPKVKTINVSKPNKDSLQSSRKTSVEENNDEGQNQNKNEDKNQNKNEDKNQNKNEDKNEDKNENEDKDEGLDHNVKFGDKQHLQIKDKLNKLFMNQLPTQLPQTKLTKMPDYPVEEVLSGSNTLKPVMSMIISEITKSNVGQDENEDGNNNELNKNKERKNENKEEEKLVDETPQTPGDIKNRLTEIFRSTRGHPNSPNKNRVTARTMSQDPDVNRNDMESHKLNMANALSTIRLRNVEKNENEDSV